MIDAVSCFGASRYYFYFKYTFSRNLIRILGDASDILKMIPSKEEMINETEDSPTGGHHCHQKLSSGTDDMLVSGGMQQYLIRQQRKISDSEVSSSSQNLCCLADCVLLEIFSYLDPKDLCVATQVCRQWYSVASDEVLWRKILERDVHSWPVISHTTNPNLYKSDTRHSPTQDNATVAEENESSGNASDLKNDNSESHFWTSKEIYLQCSPVVNRLVKKNNSNFHYISGIFRSMWPKKTPKLALFGPGLETSTSGIVRKIIECKTGLFSTVKMFPGQAGGVGSGFTLKMNDGARLDLTTLYSATREEREARTQQQRAQHNKLLAANAESGEGEWELQPYIKDLCRTLAGFIFIVDVTLSEEEITESRAELMAMIDTRWAPPTAPVLVLACVPHINSKKSLSCYQIIEKFNLQSLNRSFQVRSCILDTMTGIRDGFNWIISSCQQN